MKTITVYEKRKARVEEIPDPPRAKGLARVRVRYAGVGFADLMAVRGGYPLAPRRPFSPGYEFLGAVEEGAGSGLSPGQRVAGMLPRMGAYRELIDLDPRMAVPVPEELSDEAAALLPLNYLTALAMIERLARLERGQSFLIQGAAGGVGTAALELARELGLRAYGVASGSKRDLVAALGAVPLTREGGAWVGELKRLESEGLDAAFDSFGLPSFRRTWRALSRKGCLVCYGISPGVQGGNRDFFLGLTYLGLLALSSRGKRVHICGTPALVGRDSAWYRESMARILDWAAQKRLVPLLGGVFPWHRVEDAHGALAAGGVRGKLLLDFAK